MESTAWKVEQRLAQLSAGPLSARLDLAHPECGLADCRIILPATADEPFVVPPSGGPATESRLKAELRTCLSSSGGQCSGHLLPAGPLLGVRFPIATAGQPGSLEEALARGPDLSASYRDSAAWPVRVDCRWRAIAPGPGDRWLAAVELLVSVHTDRLDSRPGLAVESDLASPEAHILPEGGVLFRPPGDRISYFELDHPQDACGHEWTSAPGDSSRLTARYHLLAQPLEKGVILRARVRGFFCPRAGDLDIAAAAGKAFIESEPPLGD